MQQALLPFMPQQLADMYEPPFDTEKTIFQCLYQDWSARKDRVACIFNDQKTTYQQLQNGIHQFTNFFQQVVKPSIGERAVFRIRNKIFNVCAMLAFVNAGGIVTGTESNMRVPELIFAAKTVDSNLLVIDGDLVTGNNTTIQANTDIF